MSEQGKNTDEMKLNSSAFNQNESNQGSTTEPFAGMEFLGDGEIPVIPLRDMCVFPKAIVHFDLSRKKSIATVERSMTVDQRLFLVAQKDVQTNDPSYDDLYQIGVSAKIKQVIKMPNDIIRVLVEAEKRYQLSSLDIETEDIYLGVVENVEDEKAYLASFTAEEYKRQEAMRRQILALYQTYCSVLNKNNKGVVKHLQTIENLSDLMDHIAMQLAIPFAKKQMLLEAIDLQDRFSLLGQIMQEEMEIQQIRNELSEAVKKSADKNHKEFVLREQMKFIAHELGDDDGENEIESLFEAAGKLQAKEEVKTKINKEIKRLRGLGRSSSESALQRTYIDTLLEMPWEKRSEDNTDIEKAREILEEDHYGLDKIKERIVEYLAVKQLSKKGNAPILCLVGPPGTGKTSIAKSMARAMNREYVRICLGGVRDEAEIRGHRKTYVGAMPGRLAAAVKQAKVKNPLILLDEIDKMGNDRRGDTASAMLEVLDGEQNEHFMDHYLEVPLDLSDVVFVATANDISLIDAPLRDRMEIIEVTSYTETEKLHIAKNYLVKKQLKANGLTKKQLSFTDKALTKMIASYTKEAGVRNLERQIARVCRKVACEVLHDKDCKVKLTGKNLDSYLGKEKYPLPKENKQAEVGIVKGLAWTSVGGVTLEIEVNDMPGKGELKLTGQLGDVMKESAMTALSYIRFVSGEYDIADDYFEKHDLHIHIPEGATPKDGPSAGITMATAILSAVTGRKVKADVAMTGEVTLRGRVLPIGGLKEKLLAAKMAGMKTVCIPKENEPDLSEIDEEIKTGLNIMAVERMSEVLAIAFA